MEHGSTRPMCLKRNCPNVTLAVGGNQFDFNKRDLVWSTITLADGMSATMGDIQPRGDFPQDAFGVTFLRSIYALSSVGLLGSVPKLVRLTSSPIKPTSASAMFSGRYV